MMMLNTVENLSLTLQHKTTHGEPYCFVKQAKFGHSVPPFSIYGSKWGDYAYDAANT